MTAYDDLASAHDMQVDARATEVHLHLERAVRRPVPSILFEDYPREVAKREIRISDAAQRLANALQLHLD